jgi:hypothetical protein
MRYCMSYRFFAPFNLLTAFLAGFAFGGGGVWSRAATVPRKSSGSLMRVWVLCFISSLLSS